MKEPRVKSQEPEVIVNNKKRTFIFKFVARYSLLIIFFFLFTVHCSLLIGNAEAAQAAGKLTKVAGRVDVLRVGTAAAVTVKPGDTVNVGDIIRTKSDGKAEITFIDNSVMTVGPKSRLGIDEYLFKPAEKKRAASLKLYRGKTGFIIPKPVYHASGSKFEMKTRTAVAGVRGTEGILYTDGVERVYVKKGVVNFSNPLGSVVVTAGKVGEAVTGAPPSERPYSEREYKKQQEGTTPPAKAPDKKTEAEPGKDENAGGKKGEKAPPPAAPPVDADFALLPPPPGTSGLLPPPPEGFTILPPPLIPITTIALNKSFNVSAGILDGGIEWFEGSPYNSHDTAAVIQSGGSISGSFNQTILEGGYYHLDINGSYAWDAGKSASPVYPASDDSFHLFFSGNTSEGKPFYGGSAGGISVSDKKWDGGVMGWIEDGSKKYWYMGGLTGSYSNVFYNNNTGSRTGQSGTFSYANDGIFWDGSRPFWEVFSSVIPTLPGARPEFFVPITETALRTFDISINTGQSLDLKDASQTVVGSISVTSGLAGKGIELTPGSGLFDVNVKGSWSASTAIGNLRDINGTINGTTSISTSFAAKIEGGVKAISSSTAIAGAEIKNGASGANNDTVGVMIGKMTGSSSGTFDGKAIGEMKSGFILP